MCVQYGQYLQTYYYSYTIIVYRLIVRNKLALLFEKSHFKWQNVV